MSIEFVPFSQEFMSQAGELLAQHKLAIFPFLVAYRLAHRIDMRIAWANGQNSLSQEP